MLVAKRCLIRNSLPRVSRSSSSSVQRNLQALLKQKHPLNNIPAAIESKIGRNLHLLPNHPLNIIKKKIERYCNDYASNNNQSPFAIYDSESPVADVKSCFDDLLVPPGHCSRSRSDTYYLTDELLLRTHTSAHQCQFISSGVSAFLCSGDVYRRDEIDATHYPIFHQMEGVRIFTEEELSSASTPQEKKLIIENDLKNILTGLAISLFGQVEMKWKEDYFPFTQPSFELEILYNGKPLEVLGCGVIHDQVMANSGRSQQMGWAFGLGLERLAMVLFSIPDIRLFWSTDPRFLDQFQDGRISSFQSFSKFPPCFKDVSFWLPENHGSDPYHENYVFEIIRCEAGDIVERVEKFDEFTHPKTGKKSQAFRITYRDVSRNLTNAEVDEIQWRVRESLVHKLGVILR